MPSIYNGFNKYTIPTKYSNFYGLPIHQTIRADCTGLSPVTAGLGECVRLQVPDRTQKFLWYPENTGQGNSTCAEEAFGLTLG
jgi:hypothetical protein